MQSFIQSICSERAAALLGGLLLPFTLVSTRGCAMVKAVRRPRFNSCLSRVCTCVLYRIACGSVTNSGQENVPS